MKISLNWLKEYIALRESPETIAELLTDLGLEVDSMEETGGGKSDFAGIVVGYITNCEKHPDADRLSKTQVDVGTGELLNIVCGAPNVRQGQKVVVATVGSTVFDKEGKPFQIKKGKIRGAESNGMICAEDELAIGHDHSGIIVLPEDTPVGLPAAEIYNKNKDTVIEIGLTPNRSDATCHVGVAKDLAARLQIEKGYGKVVLPDVSAFKVQNHDLTLDVEVLDPEGCPRYTGVSIQGVTIGESPEWLKARLQSVGVRSISNIVDITNFILHELGQPLHAFDLDEVRGRKIKVETLPEGTVFESLDGQERKLSAQDVMICDGEDTGMCIGGVFGGLKSGVKETTKNIFLEAAYFNPVRIRRTGVRHQLRTDAQRLFEKGVDPNGAIYALKRAALLISELAGGTIASEIVDIYPDPVQKPSVRVSFDRVDALIGEKIPRERVFQILAALEMDAVAQDEAHVVVAVPTNKADVLREADVIEEILRIHGFNNVPIPSKISIAPSAAEKPDRNKLKNLIADYLASNGFNETMGMSLTRSKYYAPKNAATEEPVERIAGLAYVNNTSNAELDVMRPDMLTTALEAVAHNQNYRSLDLKLFEFGKTYHFEDGKYNEANHLALTLTGRRSPESWLQKGDAKVDFYTLKTYVQHIFARVGLSGWAENAVSDDPDFAFGVRYGRGGQIFATFGKVSNAWKKAFDIRQDVYFADLHWDLILEAAKGARISFQDLPRFPVVRRDLALVVDQSVTFSQIRQIAQKAGKKLLKETNLFDVFEDEQKLGAGKKSYAVSFIFEDKEKTLQDADVEKIMEPMIRQLEQTLGAAIRK